MHAKHYIYGRIYGRTLNASARFQGFELVTQCRKFKAVKVYLLKQKLSVLMLTFNPAFSVFQVFQQRQCIEAREASCSNQRQPIGLAQIKFLKSVKGLPKAGRQQILRTGYT